MGKISVLSFEVANLIAAGEVVDRPASCIKELIENAIDAGSTRITVEIQRGGIAYMRVADNGCGIEPEDLPVAVRRHATSKIKDASDLAAIMTLGFRGEALAAIGSVADVRIISKVRGAEYGSQIEVHSGRAGVVSERGASEGTTVIVENLFANVPARLKFLKRDQTEAMAVGTSVEKIAMSHPEISFRFISDGILKLETSGDGKLGNVIKAVYGREFASKLLPVDGESGGVHVKGYITAPDCPRANRNYQNFFINGRYVKTRTASAATEQAYASYMPPEKFPGCVLNIDIVPEAVDVNVHPSKLEVRFSNERPVFDAVYYTVRDALTSNTLRPGSRDENPAEIPAVEAKTAGIAMNSANLSQTGSRSQTEPKAVAFDIQTQAPKTNVSGAFVPVTDYSERKEYAPKQLGIEEIYTTTSGVSIDFNSRPKTEPAASVETLAVEMPQKKPEDIDNTAESAEPETNTSEISESGEGLVWRIVGELFNSYILVEEGDSVTLVDKHAAHERLNFERMKANMKKAERSTVLLAVPVELDMNNDDIAAIGEFREEIESTGFIFETDGNRLKISGLPEGIESFDASAVFETFASQIREGTGSVGMTQEQLFEKALYQASCKASIKAGRVYPPEYASWLIREMHKYPEVTYCPHGRPVAFTFKKSEIDKKFKRT